MVTQTTLARRLLSCTALLRNTVPPGTFKSSQFCHISNSMHTTSTLGTLFGVLSYNTKCIRTTLCLAVIPKRCQMNLGNKVFSSAIPSNSATVATSMRLGWSGNSDVCTTNFSRSMSGLGMGGGPGKSEEFEKNSNASKSSISKGNWNLRLANENGYLSWCRNCYLTTVVAIAMMEEGTTALAQQAAAGCFLISGLNVTWGTYQFVHNMLVLRHAMGMSALGFVAQASFAVLHLTLWFLICTLYISHAQDDSIVIKISDDDASLSIYRDD